MSRSAGRHRGHRRSERAGAPALAGLAGLRGACSLSEYFILYLTIAYFVGDGGLLPRPRHARNLSNQLSNVWPLLAVAIGQTFVIIISGHRPQPGRDHGLRQRRRRASS